jgi:glycosyltransferase involved in cell wall biosynthesis
MSINTRQLKTIGIDARFYGPLGKGLGRYTQEIVDRIISFNQLDNFFKFVIFLSPENYDDFQTESPTVKKVLVKARWYSLAEQWQLPWHWYQEKIDLMHFPHFNVPLFTPGRFIVTIHDLILTKFPSQRASTLSPLKYWFKDFIYHLVISSAVKNSRKILTVSEFTKQDIVRYFRTDPAKIVVTYEGAAQLSPLTDSSRELTVGETGRFVQLQINKPFLLYVGNAYPHKNLEKFLETFVELSSHRPDLQLALVGKIDYFYSRLQKYAGDLGLTGGPGIKPKVFFLGYVPDTDLEKLYQQAVIYVFPSLYEGFGLPPLEAMAHNCPVASSNRASMPEILGSAAAYFDPENKDDIIKIISKLLDDEAWRGRLIKEGAARVKLYSWESCAAATYNIYQELIV